MEIIFMELIIQVHNHLFSGLDKTADFPLKNKQKHFPLTTKQKNRQEENVENIMIFLLPA